MIEARREGCGLDSSGRGAAGGEERASKRAKVGLKSTRKRFYCSRVPACLCTCAFQKEKCLQKTEKKDHFSKWKPCKDVATANNADVRLFKASQ